MKIYEFFNQPVDEVAMNPGAFAKSIAQGQEKGVLVGFEFEVCVPRKTITAAQAAVTPDVEPERTKEDFMRLLSDSSFFNEIDLTTVPPAKFDSVFKSKNFGTAANFAQGFLTKRLDKLKEMFQQVPANKRTNAIEIAKARMASHGIRGNGIIAQILFARYFGRSIYVTSNRGNIERLGMDMASLAADSLNYDKFIEFWTGIDVDSDPEKLAQEFDFDEDTVRKLAQKVNVDIDEQDDYDDEVDDPDYKFTAQSILKPAVEQAMGAKVTVFSQYHERDKNLTDWYIEPDGSLNPQDEDSAAEIVSPPLPAMKAIMDLKNFYGMAQQLNLYTNQSTGLHINVSIPGDLDILKLAVFLGDQYVLQQFGRSDSGFAKSVMGDLNKNAPDKNVIQSKLRFDNGPTKELNIKVLQDIVKKISGEHTASISNNGKYISFRHAGGAYLQNYNQVYNTIGRFIRAMIIASDPALYKKEYLTKLGKLAVASEPTGASDVTAVLQLIRQQGMPILIVNAMAFSRIGAPSLLTSIKANNLTGRSTVPASVQYSMVPGTADTKSSMMASSVHPNDRDKIKQTDLSKFFTITIEPRTVQSLSVMRQLNPSPSLEQLDSVRTWDEIGFYNVIKNNLPVTDPRTQAFIKTVLKS
jgi:hypothetical protein